MNISGLFARFISWRM